MFSKKVFWVRFGFSNFFRLLETTEFFFFLKLFQTRISAWTYVFWLITQENCQKLQYQCPHKKFFGSVSGSRIFIDYSKPPNFSFFRAFPDTYIGLNLCSLVNYTRKPPKVAVSMSSKKVFWVRFGFANFFRLLKTTEFFFFPWLFQTLISA